MCRLGKFWRRGTEVIISPILIFIVCFFLGLDGKFNRSSLKSRLLKFIAITWWWWLAALPSWGRKCFQRLRFWWIAKSEGHPALVFIVPSEILRLVETVCLIVWRHNWTLSRSKNQSSKTVWTTIKIDGSKRFE